MELKIATVDCAVTVKCIGAFTNSPKGELVIVFRDNSKMVITEDHSFSVTDLGVYIYVNVEDYDTIFRELNQLPRDLW